MRAPSQRTLWRPRPLTRPTPDPLPGASGRYPPGRLGLALTAAAMLLAGCASTTEERPVLPRSVAPVAPPPQVERVPNGAIFRPDAVSSVFGIERRARTVGDTLKVDVSENLRASSRHVTDTKRDNQVSSKGPGAPTGSSNTGINRLLNLNASAAGSDAFKGKGEAESASSFTGRVAVSVIRVLGNGHLLVAGERSVALSSGSTVLRFSGVVNPADIQPGNVVASADVVDAQLEALSRGDLGESTRRGWLQRLLTDSLRVW